MSAAVSAKREGIAIEKKLSFLDQQLAGVRWTNPQSDGGSGNNISAPQNSLGKASGDNWDMQEVPLHSSGSNSAVSKSASNRVVGPTVAPRALSTVPESKVLSNDCKVETMIGENEWWMAASTIGTKGSLPFVIGSGTAIDEETVSEDDKVPSLPSNAMIESTSYGRQRAWTNPNMRRRPVAAAAAAPEMNPQTSLAARVRDAVEKIKAMTDEDLMDPAKTAELSGSLSNLRLPNVNSSATWQSKSSLASYRNMSQEVPAVIWNDSRTSSIANPATWQDSPDPNSPTSGRVYLSSTASSIVRHKEIYQAPAPLRHTRMNNMIDVTNNPEGASSMLDKLAQKMEHLQPGGGVRLSGARAPQPYPLPGEVQLPQQPMNTYLTTGGAEARPLTLSSDAIGWSLFTDVDSPSAAGALYLGGQAVPPPGKTSSRITSTWGEWPGMGSTDVSEIKQPPGPSPVSNSSTLQRLPASSKPARVLRRSSAAHLPSLLSRPGVGGSSDPKREELRRTWTEISSGESDTIQLRGEATGFYQPILPPLPKSPSNSQSCKQLEVMDFLKNVAAIHTVLEYESPSATVAEGPAPCNMEYGTIHDPSPANSQSVNPSHISATRTKRHSHHSTKSRREPHVPGATPSEVHAGGSELCHQSSALSPGASSSMPAAKSMRLPGLDGNALYAWDAAAGQLVSVRLIPIAAHQLRAAAPAVATVGQQLLSSGTFIGLCVCVVMVVMNLVLLVCCFSTMKDIFVEVARQPYMH
ncbi:hypothetical protein CEUSTIGMA_g5501.t1 [Chlamydomonas eustigma]|uniref:Uncharacterized protein n=1 Tax=Chlamydomonas eustigma TaxID=1157962 RepID=A0A250X566_9CHLO|nr:hypothetical protein CEUSTIGMA_g5501.t1 [Chlamydomonas eustigma]|eukprot:GAX78059.1 hypothetical protein CEUSTIGMA_g5501.t1 [Chlamydomonas eustigma]